MKKLIILCLLCFYSHANAGFISGFVVGKMSSSSAGGETLDQKDAILVVSDKHDVISCFVGDSTTNCRGLPKDITPEQFAVRAGYKTLLRVGYLARPGGRDMIVMEVAR